MKEKKVLLIDPFCKNPKYSIYISIVNMAY